MTQPERAARRALARRLLSMVPSFEEMEMRNDTLSQAACESFESLTRDMAATLIKKSNTYERRGTSSDATT